MAYFYNLETDGLVADIKQAFFQIEITGDHGDLLCFLWFLKYQERTNNTYHVAIHPCRCRINFKPIFIEPENQHHLEKYMLNPNFTEIIKKVIINL